MSILQDPQLTVHIDESLGQCLNDPVTQPINPLFGYRGNGNASIVGRGRMQICFGPNTDAQTLGRWRDRRFTGRLKPNQ